VRTAASSATFAVCDACNASTNASSMLGEGSTHPVCAIETSKEDADVTKVAMMSDYVWVLKDE
jgi:hypothetical protein